MAKSLRSKREKRLRTLRREISEPFHEKKEVAKYVAQEAALAAPKLPVKVYKSKDGKSIASMEVTDNTSITANSTMDVEMGDAGTLSDKKKPLKAIGKKMKKKFKIGRGKRQGQGKTRRKHHI